MLRKVKFYGELADFIGYKELDAVINSTADAVSFLINTMEPLLRLPNAVTDLTPLLFNLTILISYP